MKPSNYTLEKRATILFDCGKKYLVSMGLEKEAGDSKFVIRFLEGIKEKENFGLYKQAFCLEKEAKWNEFWTKSLKPAMKYIPQKLGVKPSTFWGGLAGAGIGALGGGLTGRSFGSSLAGGLAGGALGAGVGHQYGDPIQKWLEGNVFNKKLAQIKTGV